MNRVLPTICFALLCSGCGTMANLEGKEFAFLSHSGVREPRLYGGVRNDLEWKFYLDIPCSAIADTLTIPIVLQRQSNDDLPASPEVTPGLAAVSYQSNATRSQRRQTGELPAD
jgi:uncharacterized protein YceK